MTPVALCFLDHDSMRVRKVHAIRRRSGSMRVREVGWVVGWSCEGSSESKEAQEGGGEGPQRATRNCPAGPW